MQNTVCKICGKTNIETKLTFNTVQGDFLCLDCYKNQFKKTTMNLTPNFP